MDLGVRQIRSAGKGSGSIELTLPTGLRDLVGVPCRIILRDGSRPDIVLQPDLRCAHQAFSEIWQAMAAVLLRKDADIPALPLGAFGFGLHPHTGGGELPFLCWRDGLALAASPPHDPDVISRAVAALGQAMAAFMPIDPALASGFGAACGYLVSGRPPACDQQAACDIAIVALHLADQNPDLLSHSASLAPVADSTADAGLACANGVMDDAFWRHGAPLLSAAADLYVGWPADPSGRVALRAALRRDRTIDMSGD